MTGSKIKKIIAGGFEIVKDSTKEIAGAVGPGALLEHALGQDKPKANEMGDYLKNIGDPELKGDKLKQKEAEINQKDQAEMENARRILAGLPPHMQLPREEKKLRPYEEKMKEEEKKAQEVEAMQQKQQNSLAEPIVKQQRGSMRGKRKSPQKGFEGLKKDTKVG